jgi:hypothetical protein
MFAAQMIRFQSIVASHLVKLIVQNAFPRLGIGRKKAKVKTNLMPFDHS